MSGPQIKARYSSRRCNMSPSQPPSARQITQISAAVNFYIHYNDPSVSAGGHNDHAVIAWAVLDDNMTVMPLIASPSDAQTIIQANTLSTDYQIHNPYSQCQA